MNSKCLLSLFFSIILIICLVFNVKSIFAAIKRDNSKGIGLSIFAAVICALALAVNLNNVITSIISD